MKGKERILEIERGSTRSHGVGNSLWKGLRTCRKEDNIKNDSTSTWLYLITLHQWTTMTLDDTCHTESGKKETSEVLRFSFIFVLPFCLFCCDAICFLCLASSVQCLPDKLSSRDVAASCIKSVPTIRSTALSPLYTETLEKLRNTLAGQTAVAEGEEQQTVL